MVNEKTVMNMNRVRRLEEAHGDDTSAGRDKYHMIDHSLKYKKCAIRPSANNMWNNQKDLKRKRGKKTLLDRLKQQYCDKMSQETVTKLAKQKGVGKETEN